MASHDLPAMLKFVTTKTSQSSIYYVGHSQGTLMAFAEFSRNKELAKMVKKYFALGPVATVGHLEGLLKYMADFSPEIEVLNITMFNLLLLIVTNLELNTGGHVAGTWSGNIPLWSYYIGDMLQGKK